MAFTTAIRGAKFTILSRLKAVKILSISVIPSNPRSVLTLSALNLQRNGTNMKCLKSTYILVSMIVLIVLSLPVSFASTPSFNSPLPEPAASVLDNASGHIVSIPVVLYNSNGFYSTSSTCILQIHTLTFPVGSSPIIKYSGSRFYASVQYTYSMRAYDVITGSYLWERNERVYQNNPVRVPDCPFEVYCIPQSQGSYPDQYMIAGSYASYYNFTPVDPFVTWSQLPLEHNVYHSELSEPVADEYNSYFICNDRLYWLSYRANGLYTFSQTVELNSQIYEEPVSYNSSGSGTYVGQQNGFTEEVTGYAPYFTGSTGDGTIVTGTLTPPDFGQIDFVGVNQGQLRVNSNGQFTYNDLEVFPVGISNQVLNRLFDVVIYLTDSSGFKVWLVPRSDLGQSLVLAADLYCSVFDLTNGEYISSSFSSYTGSYQHAGFDFPLDEDIADVRCYGCAFYNVNNVPVGLSDVLWQYDLEFVQWRDSMLNKLEQIYNLLNSTPSSDEPTTYKDFGGEIAEAEPSYQGQVDADQVAGDLDAAINGDFNFGSAASAMRTWVDWFSIPKIIALCVFALATGSVILILGKKKSD